MKNDLGIGVLTRNLDGLTGQEVVELVHEIQDGLNLKRNIAKISNATNATLNFQENIQPSAPNFPTANHKCRYITPKRIPYMSYHQEQ